MTLHVPTLSRRRGACPGLSAPMPTGDGLLVRLLPIGTIALAAFTALCAAARAHGNGVVEVTSRGSIQVRGLSPTSAPRFADAVAALGIAAEDGVPVHCNPLAGLDAEEILDAGVLAADLRRALLQRGVSKRLSPKVSVAIDGGGELNLATLTADIRLTAQADNGGVMLRVGVGGNAASATDLGLVPMAQGVDAVMRLLDILAQHGHDARARDLVSTEGATVFSAAIADLVDWGVKARKSEPNEALGVHHLRDGSAACGIAPAFGHADAVALERLAEAAAKGGASGLRAAPGRVLLAIRLAPEMAPAFAADAEQFGFIVRADDPRRRVVACAGAPVCASAHIASRALAPLIAETVAAQRDDTVTVHISGCAKGCAHAAPAALTIVGTPAGCALVANGSVRDMPFAVVPVDRLPDAIATAAHAPKQEADHV